jgi:hypothetical protein
MLKEGSKGPGFLPPPGKDEPLRDDVIDQISPNDLDELYTNDESSQPISPGFGNGFGNGFGGVFSPGGFGSPFHGPQTPFGPPSFGPPHHEEVKIIGHKFKKLFSQLKKPNFELTWKEKKERYSLTSDQTQTK